MYNCKCGRTFDKGGSLISHGRFCDFYEKKNKKTKYLKDGKYQCECGKTFLGHQSLNGHFSKCMTHRKDIPYIISHGGGWNKGMKKEQNEGLLRMSEKLSILQKGKIGKKHTKESKEKISKKAANYKSALNGYIKTKNYKVFCQALDKYVYVQGTWELKYTEYLDSNDIKWIRNREIGLKYKYTEDDYYHTYYPDFYLINEKVYVEIKGYMWKGDSGKNGGSQKIQF